MSEITGDSSNAKFLSIVLGISSGPTDLSQLVCFNAQFASYGSTNMSGVHSTWQLEYGSKG